MMRTAFEQDVKDEARSFWPSWNLSSRYRSDGMVEVNCAEVGRPLRLVIVEATEAAALASLRTKRPVQS